jgi:Zn-dependent protease/CBS domain-containing protein
MEGPNAAGMAVPPIVWGIVLAVGLFVSVLLHELAHAVVALRSGARVHSITLMMLGGVTRMETDVRPEREAWMAFAGPLMSFAIAAVSFALYRLLPLPAGPSAALEVFAVTNAILGVFNLLPAFPMDGGRVLRGLLAPRFGSDRATAVATTLGKIMAIVFALVGLLTFNLVLVLIAAFVYMGASAEAARHEQRDVLRGVPVALMMSDRLGEAYPDEPTRDVARRLMRDRLAGVRVRSDDPAHRTLGVVTTFDLEGATRTKPSPERIESAMRTDLPRVRLQDDGSSMLDLLASGRVPAVLVVDDSDDIVGVVTPSDIHRAIALSLLARNRRPHPVR